MIARKQVLGNKGSLLNTVILVLVSLCVIGVILARLAVTDVRIASNDKATQIALVHADAGAEEARARLALPDTDANRIRQAGAYSTAWRLFIGSAAAATKFFGYDPNNANHILKASTNTQAGMNYVVMVRHKIESDNGTASANNLNGDGDWDDIVYYGDYNAAYISVNGGHDYNLQEENPSNANARPVEVITSRATVGGAARTVTTQARSHLLILPGPAALYVGGTLDKDGTTGTATGSPLPGVNCPSVPDVATVTGNVDETTCSGHTVTPDHTKHDDTTPKIGGCTTITEGSGKNETVIYQTAKADGDGCGGAEAWSGCASYPTANLVTNSPQYPVPTVVSSLSTLADRTLTASNYQNQTWGTASKTETDPGPQVTFYDAPRDDNGNLVPLSLSGTTDGYGILVVRGPLEITGNISWHGLIIVDGPILFSGGGTKEIYGSVMADDNCQINGSPDIFYDCTYLNVPNSNGFSEYERVKWKDF